MFSILGNFIDEVIPQILIRGKKAIFNLNIMINHENSNIPNICYESNSEITIRIRSNLPQIILTTIFPNLLNQLVKETRVLIYSQIVWELPQILIPMQLDICCTMGVIDNKYIAHISPNQALRFTGKLYYSTKRGHHIK